MGSARRLAARSPRPGQARPPRVRGRGEGGRAVLAAGVARPGARPRGRRPRPLRGEHRRPGAPERPQGDEGRREAVGDGEVQGVRAPRCLRRREEGLRGRGVRRAVRRRGRKVQRGQGLSPGDQGGARGDAEEEGAEKEVTRGGNRYP